MYRYTSHLHGLEPHKSGGHRGSCKYIGVDAYAVNAAVVEARTLWPGLGVHVQPHNNPGFDLMVGDLNAPTRFVEVKGTMMPIPRFFLSEGEREFSHLDQASHRVYVSHGAVTDPPFDLRVSQWHGELKT